MKDQDQLQQQGIVLGEPGLPIIEKSAEIGADNCQLSGSSESKSSAAGTNTNEDDTSSKDLSSETTDDEHDDNERTPLFDPGTDEARFRFDTVMAAAAKKDDPPLVYFKPSNLRDREVKAVDEFLRLQNWSSSDAKCWNIAVKFLMARKFDVDRAVKLYAEHDHLRKREGLDYINLNDEDFNRDLETGKFTILPFIKNYPVCALFTVRLHNGNLTSQSELTTLKTLIYQLDAALENPDAQRNGINFIYDMNNCKRSNYDLTLSQKILTLVRGSYPARLNKLLVVSAPFWFKCVVKVLFVTNEELKNQVPAEILPDYLGGNVKLNHKAWLAECNKLVTNKASTCSYYYHFTTSSAKPPPSSNSNSSTESASSMTTTSISSKGTAPLPPTAPNGGDELNSSRKRQSSSEFVDLDDISKKNSKKQISAIHDANINGQYILEKIEPLPFQNHFQSIQNVDPDDHSGLTIDQLLQHVITTGAMGLSEEFKVIRSQPIVSSFEAFKLRENMYKNRYRDVICLDESRVYLEVEQSSATGDADFDNPNDYIHANYVDGYKQKNAYISTQGPLEETIEDFWRMIWQQSVLVIAMTTKCYEQKKLKCAQYWPLEKGERMQIGDSFEVINLQVSDLDDYRVSKLELRDVVNNKSRIISHCQFLSWPDHGVPKSAAQILDFISLVRVNQAERLSELEPSWLGHPLGPPICVHCSAGIGRTGTFCAIEISVNRLRDCGNVNILDTVNKIRAQRAQSVQMRDQYVFCYLAVIEYAQRERLLAADHAKIDLVKLFESLF